MKIQRLALIAGTILAFIALAAGAGLVNAGQNGFAVNKDAYTVGSVAVSPNGVYIGDTVRADGTGEVANAAFQVYMGGTYTGDGKTYLAKLGDTVTDSKGNWSYTFTVPPTCTRIDDGATVAVFRAAWPVGGVAQGPDKGYYFTWTNTDLTIYGARSPSTTPTSSPAGSALSGATLPNTGARILILAAGLMSGGLFLAGCAPAACARWRNRRE